MAELVVAGPPAPPPMTFRDRLTQFRILEEKRCELIEELLDKLEKTEARLAQCELDLGSEQNVRRTLQAEIADVTRTMQGQLAESKAKEEALVQSQAKRPFVLVLIDADAEGFLFHDKYITRKAQGGESLADELNIRIREYLREQFPDDADSLDIIVRVYANLEGMANYLVRLDKVRNLGQLRAFSTGFCGRITSFDWIDTGVGKEGGAGRKVRENLSFFASNTHLRHAIVACSPVDLPASLLTTIPLEKLTLIESLPLPTSLTTMPLKTAKFHTLFPPPPPSKAPKPSRERGRNDRGLSETDVRRGDREMRRGDERGGGPQLQLMEQEHEGGGSTWLVIQPERSKSQTVSGRDRDRRRAGSEDDTSSLSISIGPDNTVQVDSGRRRRLMG
ncbi:hypothetical protein GT037_009414 [Alternaria burnsii]|uniref:DUF7923 domain-containing protein n=5 Tax=Alternaria sect. Alternaria TaxID=2499237 RepID=A0A177DE62_ALTAL|nr:hypothetical protein CC77DRAFT_1022294 [Alternaria alternata]XP_028508191.1 hypothetical protein AA0111_g4611 [Alternaria arborescens]XP_038782736.1 uncharacterized protein GT037_009414 [Alternaria burnsii]XP_051590487.1 uncharacterized protein J4E82_003528 [Alternaria postmessia]KAB2108927.1 hypothetical protein AG0111_0g3540 [Alternaria gaisen]RII14474.1 hypothetical protein CUC08_Gglean004056 [Alternaria sp. MG1]RYN29314.1 hypothetical protein AA0115_g5203 [Alternaria tenuissima]KAF767